MKIIIFGGDSDMAKSMKKWLPRWFDCVVLAFPRINGDVTRIDEVREVLASSNVKETDWVINCAGVSHVAMLSESNYKDWTNEVNTNLMGSFVVAKEAAVYTENMIFIGSVAGLYGKPEHSGYSASKAGVISLVQSLGKEGYNAYCISPGRVDTKMRQHEYPGEDIRTRLTTKQITAVVREIMENKHTGGDNIIIRKRGYRTLRRIDKGAPWRKYLNL